MQIVKPGFTFVTPPSTFRGMLQRIEAAGRTCYKSEDKITEDSAEKFVALILKRGHESVIEHESISVRIICDRGVSHEIVRHRLASYSQESTRYCNYGNGVTFIQPPNMSEHQITVWRAAMTEAEDAYLCLINECNTTAQIARSVLPNSLKTEIVMTCNLREWRHFFKVRAHKAAHPQMREIATPMLAEFKKLIPIIFDDLESVLI